MRLLLFSAVQSNNKFRVLDIYQELLSLKFFQIEDAELWHEDAIQYAVFDAKTLEGSQGAEGFLGYLHLE